MFGLLLASLIAVAPTPASCTICWYGPDNIAFAPSGNLYVVDTDAKTQSRVVELTQDGRLVASWHVFAQGSGGRSGPEGIARRSDGTILVTDAGAQRILELSQHGTVIGTFGGADGVFPDLGHVAIDRAGNVYVSQGDPNLIEKFSPSGELIAKWHRERGSGPEQWNRPETIATLPNGNLVVEDWGNRRIEILDPSGSTVLTFGRAGRSAGEFLNTAGLGVDRAGNIYVADMGLHRVQKFDSSGRLLAIIADTTHHLFMHGGPTAVAIDAQGNLYSPDGLTLVKYTQDGRLIARWE